MNIGIDIDDTIADTTSQLLKYFKKYKEMNPEEGEDKIFKQCKSLLRGIDLDEEAKNFYHKYAKELTQNVIPKTNAIESIKVLKEQGHQIYIITTRGDKHFKGIYEATYDWLQWNQIVFDELICDANEKVQACQEKQIDLMIDDSVQTCELLNTHGISTLIMNSLFNEKDSTNLPRAKDWNEVKEFIEKLN